MSVCHASCASKSNVVVHWMSEVCCVVVGPLEAVIKHHGDYVALGSVMDA